MTRVMSGGWLVFAAVFMAGCGGEKPASGDGTAAAAPQASAAAAPTGKIITINMISDEKSNRFEPNEVEAHPGDVLRFTIVVGVHNVHFLADSNPGVADLPPASDLLQLPGQTLDIPVTFAPGKTYYFQCDPHAALGMQGHLKVEADG
jgi:plastocyanin